VERQQLGEFIERQPSLGVVGQALGNERQRLLLDVHDSGGNGIEAMGLSANDNGGEHEREQRSNNDEDQRDERHCGSVYE